MAAQVINVRPPVSVDDLVVRTVPSGVSRLSGVRIGLYCPVFAYTNLLFR